MPDRTVNERIAKLLGWAEPMSVTSYHADWLAPDSSRHEYLPLFETDPAAAMELVEQCSNVELTRISAWNWAAKATLRDGRRIGRTKIDVVHTLPAAIAAAYLAATEAEGG